MELSGVEAAGEIRLGKRVPREGVRQTWAELYIELRIPHLAREIARPPLYEADLLGLSL